MQPSLVDMVKVTFETQEAVKGKNNWEGESHTPRGDNKCLFAPDRAPIDLRDDSTHTQLTEPVSVLVIYESVGKGSLTGAWMTQRQPHCRKAHPSVRDSS